MKILVVEDEKDLCDSLVEGLRLDGYAVDSCKDGEAADSLAFSESYDLIVLDLNLPKMDGLEMLQNLRNNNKSVNVIILSARGTLEDKIKGLDIGANDYMVKPFHFAELQARVRSLLRRKTVQEDIILKCSSVCLNTNSHSVTVKGMAVSLTNKETAILEYLLLHRGRIVSPHELLEHVWNQSVDSFSNSVRVHISSLRRKICVALGNDIITNVIGEGYIIKESDNEN